MLEWFYHFAAYAEMHGLSTALAFICLIQYVMHIYARQRDSEQEVSYLEELEILEDEVSSLQHERYLARVENAVLRDIFSNIEQGKAIDLLLKNFVPKTTQGFAVFFCSRDNRLSVYASRGLDEQICNDLNLDTDWLKKLTSDDIVRIAGKELSSSQFLKSLDGKSRRKIHELYLIPVNDRDGAVGVIATTLLFPHGVASNIQKQLISRILESVTGSLKQTMTLHDQELKLKLSQEKLVLRSIADRHHGMPSKLMDEYMLRLTNLLEANRGALLLLAPGPNGALKVISRQGISLQAGTETIWQEHELRLAQAAYETDLPTCLGASELAALNVDSLIGSALTVPLFQQERLIGILCMTRRDRGTFSKMQVNLARWAADFLAETLLRVLDRVEVERKANMDGLTELANRRTFDLKIRQELAHTRESGATCSLCLLDLDHFKAVNDHHGHQAGDEVLRQFARILESESKKVRSTDCPLVARYGGEEMAILLPGVGLEGAIRIGESIRHAASQMVILHNQQRIRVTVSIGVASSPRHATTAEALIEAADQALYQAKSEGRNAVRAAQIDTDAVGTNRDFNQESLSR